MGTALIDGDVLKYQLGFAVQKTVWTHKESKDSFDGKKKAKDWWAESAFTDFDENEWDTELVVEPWESCRALIEMKIGEIMQATKASKLLMCLSPHKCFRDELAFTREYKGNRPDHKPEYYHQIHQYFLDTCPHEVGDNIEADDLMGKYQNSKNWICTVDKDLNQVPGQHYNFSKGDRFDVDDYEGDMNFFIQLLSGDSTDNIQGIPGVGAVKAANFIASLPDHEWGPFVQDQFDIHYPGTGEEVLKEHAQLIWILRGEEKPFEQNGWYELIYGKAHKE